MAAAADLLDRRQRIARAIVMGMRRQRLRNHAQIEVVDDEAIGVERKPGPREPERCEQAREAQEPERRHVCREAATPLDDGGDARRLQPFIEPWPAEPLR